MSNKCTKIGDYGFCRRCKTPIARDKNFCDKCDQKVIDTINKACAKKRVEDKDAMGEKLKPCFCGRELSRSTHNYIHEISTSQYLSEDQCSLSGNLIINYSDAAAIRMWNNRPIEDALKARIEELEGALHEYRCTDEYCMQCIK